MVMVTSEVVGSKAVKNVYGKGRPAFDSSSASPPSVATIIVSAERLAWTFELVVRKCESGIRLGVL